MKSKKKKLLSLVIATVFCMTSFAVSGAAADKAYAEGIETYFPENISMIYYPKDKINNYYWLGEDTEVTIDMDSVQTTDTEVASVIYDSGYDVNYYYYILTDKAGKATVSFKAKYTGSENWTDITLEVKSTKYVRPCKSIKVGKKNYTKKFNNSSLFYSKKKISGKVNVTPAKGWKITGIWYYKFKKDKEKRIKNKTKITLNNGDYLYVEFKKKGVYEYVVIYR